MDRNQSIDFLKKNITISSLYKTEGVSERVITMFQQEILRYYSRNKRQFPWRKTTDPYKILVSELMLQQTQTDRVVTKYEAFLNRFPSFTALAGSSLADVLTIWQGLGYNRRALYLKQTAEIVTDRFAGKLPVTLKELTKLPGIGKYTASALRVFIHNQPEVVLETNIRTVYIYFFFPDNNSVSDQQLIPLISQTLYHPSPRDWFYAVMDYGSMLKRSIGNIAVQSKHYTKQSPLEGSNRQIRAKIIALLLQHASSFSVISKKILSDQKRLEYILKKMEKERLIVGKNGKYSIPE